ncbi:MAG TPA: amino acid ABC transporter substrate-binding protein [Devosiaceae bacterium]|jgi:general L-amino acid transport system substrate-binding protein
MTRLLGALFVLAALCDVAAAQQGSTLKAVRDRGHLICAATRQLPGFSQQTDGVWSGFDVDLCRAVAAAVLGDPNKVEFRSLGGDSRFAYLQTGQVDLLTRNAPWTLKRDTAFGATYVTPMFFDGEALMVPQSLGVVSAYELDNVSVCLIDGSDEQVAVRNFFFENQATYTEVQYEDLEDLGVAYSSGLCDAVAAPARWLNAIRRGLPEPATHRILPERITKEMLGPVVRQGDEQWYDIVEWTMYALINAEELGVSSRNIDSMSTVNNSQIKRLLGLDGDFGTPIGLDAKFMARVIRSVGNYAEIYERNFGPQTGAALPRGQNSLWSNGGLLYAPPVR